jgi:nickel/cobalt exporter
MGAMTPFSDLIAQGAGNAWFFIPSAILLGALHGLEPGHSKTMMAAFIVAVRGTVTQAILLGLAATVSHTFVVWAVALGGMWLWQGMDAEAVEPWFQLVSGVIIVALALWMIQRTRADRRHAVTASGLDHDHDHVHPAETREIDTGHGVVELSIHGHGQAPRWRLRTLLGQPWAAGEVTLTTERPDGSRQAFAFAPRDGALESADAIPGPHEFMARLSLSHGGHGHHYDLAFVEGSGDDPIHREMQGLDLVTAGAQDAHELAHANDIRQRFQGRDVTTWQIVLFGLTGGLLPCPAAITVLLICLQLKEFALGAVLVLCFSIGLALTLVAVGVVAAVGARHARSRLPWLSAAAAKAPYLSGALIALVGLYVCWHGATELLS